MGVTRDERWKCDGVGWGEGSGGGGDDMVKLGGDGSLRWWSQPTLGGRFNPLVGLRTELWTLFKGESELELGLSLSFF